MRISTSQVDHDKYGTTRHRVLRGVGEVVRIGVRKIDTAAAYGGDEFVALCRKRIRPVPCPREKIRIGVTEIDITVSVGASTRAAGRGGQLPEDGGRATS